MSYVNTFGGGTVQSANTSYKLYDVSLANLTLLWPMQVQDVPNVVYDFMDIYSTNAGRTIKLPAANLASVGVSFNFINVGPQSINILDASGATLVTINPARVWEVYLTDNTGAAGIWQFIPNGNGTIGVVSLTSVPPASGLSVTQNANTGAITQTFALTNDLAALENLSGTGYATRTANNTWALRNITAGANIGITEPAGTNANTTVALNTTLTGMVAINVGNLNLSVNTISSILNTDIILEATGSGFTKVNGPLYLLDNGVTPSSISFFDATAANSIIFQSPASPFGANSIYTLPSALPTLDGQVLSASIPVASRSALSWTTLPVVQTRSTVSTAAQNAPLIIPYDDTIPQIGEGTLLLSTAITPRYTGRLIVEFTASLANTSVAANIIVALFQDATANALTAGAFWCAAAGSGTPLSLRYVVPAAVAGVPTTFTIRYGISTAGSAFILTGNSGTGTLGAVPQMSLTVTELAP